MSGRHRHRQCGPSAQSQEQREQDFVRWLDRQSQRETHAHTPAAHDNCDCTDVSADDQHEFSIALNRTMPDSLLVRRRNRPTVPVALDIAGHLVFAFFGLAIGYGILCWTMPEVYSWGRSESNTLMLWTASASALYFLCIAAALVRNRKRMTKLANAVLEKGRVSGTAFVMRRDPESIANGAPSPHSLHEKVPDVFSFSISFSPFSPPAAAPEAG